MSIDLFATTLFHRGLPYFSLLHDPNALRTGSSPTLEWGAGVCFSSLCAASCDSVQSSARPLGAPESLVSGASGAGSRRFGGSASGQGSVEPASGSVTTSGSIRASSSYLETIRRFIRSRVFSRCVA